MTRQSPARVALVHDWLTGMRGGEKVLEVLCELYPDATLFTLIHNPGSVMLCMFKDMGWTVTVSGSSSASASTISAPGFVVFSPDNVTVMVTETLYLPLVMNGGDC